MTALLRRVFAWGILGLMLWAPIVSARNAADEDKQPLSLAQVQGLIEHDIPDEVIAGEIAANGVDFTVTPETLKVLRVKGAGPQTLEQLNRRVARPRVTILAGVAGAKVFLDGKERGETSAEGRLELRDVKPGRREIQVQKAGYATWKDLVELQTGRDLRVEAKLKPQVVRVILSGNREGARLDLAGCKRIDATNEFDCIPPGTYRASGECPSCLPWLDDVEVHVGEERKEISTDFKVDPAWREARIEAGRKSWKNQDAAAMATEAQALLGWNPSDPEGMSLAAGVAYLRDEGPEFLRLAQGALASGGTVSIPLRRTLIEEKDKATWLGKLLNPGKTPQALVPVEIVLSAKEVTFILASGSGTSGMPAAETRTSLPRQSIETAALGADGHWLELTGRLPDSPRVWTLARLTDRRAELKETPRKFLQVKAKYTVTLPEAAKGSLTALKDLFQPPPQ